jgi:hypothetical protein
MVVEVRKNSRPGSFGTGDLLTSVLKRCAVQCNFVPGGQIPRAFG